ncbi:MAG: PIN domain-containing protein [Luteolibacter sp.]
MSAKVFLDTNILAYTFDRDSPSKRARTTSLLREENWAISWQVVQEFSSVALHRFSVPLTEKDLADYIDLILMPRCNAMPSRSIYLRALEIRKLTGYRFYDSLIVAGALESGAETLYSEDLQNGRTIGSLKIVNPFN